MTPYQSLMAQRLKEKDLTPEERQRLQDEIDRATNTPDAQQIYPTPGSSLQLMNALDSTPPQQSSGPSFGDLLKMKSMASSSSPSVANSYMGGSGPAQGSFRGAQEAGLGSTSASAGGPSMSNLLGGTSSSGAGAVGTPLLWAYLIGQGKMQENSRLSKDPNDPLGNFGLAMLAPSGAQIKEDPVGMGLPTLLGAPFLTPFTASKKSKQQKPEWSGLWSGLGL
jgi:hypothetical protein